MASNTVGNPSMVAISETAGASGICTVVVTVDAKASLMPALREHAERGLEHFPTYAGYLGGALHLSADGTRLVQYLQWRSEAEYVACRDDPRWEQSPSTRLFREAARSGEAQVDARSFAVVATSTGSSGQL